MSTPSSKSDEAFGASSSDDVALDSTTNESWIAIEPPMPPRNIQVISDLCSEPPSFSAAQFDIVLRRQHQRSRDGGGVKKAAIPSRFLNLSDTFEFSGWGTLSRIELDPSDISYGEKCIQDGRRAKTLGQFTASALAGNAVLGSVFYALPAVVIASGVYSPISLFIATLVLFLWRPIMEELASALPFGGAPYTYLLNVSSKWLALLGAAMLLLDYASTSVVSAATAAAYLSGEVSLPFPAYVGALLVVVVFTIPTYPHHASFVCCLSCGVGTYRELADTRELGYGKRASPSGTHCTPSYVSSIKPGRFPRVLRNLHYPAIFLNCLSMLFLLALVPLETILSGANVLSALASVAAGKWLRIWVVVDAVVVLCGGVLTGILGACELSDRLARDRLLPRFFLRRLTWTHAPFVSIVFFALFCCVLYAASGASLSIVSKMFSLIWLAVMTLFPIAVLLLKFNRGRLPRQPRTSLTIVFSTLIIAFVIIGGNIAIDPTIVGYAAAYLVALATIFYVTMKKGRFVRWFLWIYDQSSSLNAFLWTKNWGHRMAKMMMHMRRQPVCLLVKTDEINRLFHKLLYVCENEETSRLKLVHFYDEEGGIPSEMEANWKILDEAFPEITVDLVLVRGPFNPLNVAALANRLQVPTTLMFMSCPGQNFSYPVADFGTRIISL
ncbi:unnamed protein product [Somion occarium]|uniref:Uncharacterized protein n=1 Tax=Somion occarium TaxID=3059160 RepID=A0ABP1CT29_9APHY